MTVRAVTVWNAVALAVYLFAVCVSIALARGQLDPINFAYYGVAVDWRMPTLMALLAALQVLWVGDAVILGRRLKSAPVWAVLVLASIVGPCALVMALGQLDGWRYDHRSSLVNVGVGAAMVLAIVTIYACRDWAFRHTAARAK